MLAASRRAPTTEPVLVDTGLLYALHAPADPYHALARHWVARFEGRLHTVGSVLA